MRGSHERAGALFSYVDLEARVRGDHPLRPIREVANAALKDLSDDFAGALYELRPAVDRAGEASAGNAVASFLRGTLRAPADGADGVRPSVPLVRGAGGGRSGLGSFQLFEEPGPAAGRSDSS